MTAGGAGPPGPRAGAAATRVALPVRSRVALAAIAALALALRTWRLAHGLPDFLDEALPFRLALGMWSADGGRPDWNPHHFHYPSLTIYLHLLLQQAGYALGRLTGAYRNTGDFLLGYLGDPTPMVIPARLLEVGFDLAALLGAARIGERLKPGAGLLGALLVACSATLIRTSRAIYTDTVMGALVVWGLERALAWRASGRRADLLAAGALVGLAAGAKYPGVALLIPLAWVAWEREGARAWKSWLAGGAVALLAFLVTTPFALLDLRSFLRDTFAEGLHAAEGHLGSFGRSGFLFHLGDLAQNLGGPGVALLALSLARTLAAPRRGQGTATTVWLAVLALGLPISLAHIAADRYLAPLVPLAAVLAAAAALDLAGWAPPRWRSRATGLAVALLALPPLATGFAAVAGDDERTRIEARRWCEAHLRPDELMVQEAYGVALPTASRWLDIRSGAEYAAASTAARRRFDARRLYRVVDLPLSVSGRCANVVAPSPWGGAGPPVEIEIFPNAVDFNRVFYDPRLFHDADYVLTSRAVRGRFTADPDRYAIEGELYRLLDRSAVIAARIRPPRPGEGPEITIYRLGPAAREALAASGPLDVLWWAEMIPVAYRRRATLLLTPGGSPPDSTPAVRLPDGAPPPWVLSLAPIYLERIRPFTRVMAIELAELGRLDAARRFARATLEMAPGDDEACLIAATCDEQAGDWPGARATLERTLAARGAADDSPALRLEYAVTLVHTGDRERGRRELERVRAAVRAGSPLDIEARARLAELGVEAGH